MLDITGAGTQHPMRSHWKLRPGPQSHKNSKQQCKRYRANTVTANSKASATRQTAQQPQLAPPKPVLQQSRNHSTSAQTRQSIGKTFTSSSVPWTWRSWCARVLALSKSGSFRGTNVPAPFAREADRSSGSCGRVHHRRPGWIAAAYGARSTTERQLHWPFLLRHRRWRRCHRHRRRRQKQRSACVPGTCHQRCEQE